MPDNSSTHEVIVYHDETQFLADRSYKGHVLLFVPVRISETHTTPLFGTEHYKYCPQQLLFQSVMQTRQQYGLDDKLRFTDISGKKWT